MYCHQCGEKLNTDAKFCSHCGTEIHTDSVENKEDITDQSENQLADETEKPAEEAPSDHLPQEIDQTQARQKSRLTRVIPFLIPLISFIIVLSGLLFYYFQEKSINEEVLSLKESSEELAVKGDYKKALKQIKQALNKRPNYSALKSNKDTIEKALDYEKTFAEISDYIKKTEFDKAAKELNEIKELLNGEKSPIFEAFLKQIEQSEINITVGTIKKELNNLTTVDELGGKLSILASLPEKEASAVKQEILNKIVQLSTDEAESEIANRQFSEAFSTLDKGLQFAVNNEKLLTLKERVEQEQNAFELAEQQRIEKAMEVAAQEDIKNRTAAVEVLDLFVEVDEFGDMYMNGTVKNVATTDVHSITIYYTIYDASQTYWIGESFTTVYPYYLAPEETGSFEDIYFGVYEDVYVEIDRINWYLN